MSSLPGRVEKILNMAFSIPVNCFCISQFYFTDCKLRLFSADETLDFANQNFKQVSIPQKNSLCLVWSRTAFDIPDGKIQISEVAKRQAGFPHGLILEHSFVMLEETRVFQKADPKLSSKVEILSLDEALDTYKTLKGYELTWHIPIVQF